MPTTYTYIAEANLPGETYAATPLRTRAEAKHYARALYMAATGETDAPHVTIHRYPESDAARALIQHATARSAPWLEYTPTAPPRINRLSMRPVDTLSPEAVRIVEHADTQGMSLSAAVREVAQAADVSPRAIEGWIYDNRTPRPALARRVNAVLDTLIPTSQD